MKKYVIIVLLLVIVVAGFFWKKKPTGNIVTVAGKKVSVEIADTDAKREKGLSERKSLCADCGMLFVFDKPDIYSFWMPEMNFNIDIIWIADNKVADITFNAKKPSGADYTNPREYYFSKVPVDKVLEVNSGWVKKNNIMVGDAVVFI